MGTTEKSAYPGGMIGNVPKFNAAKRRHVEESNIPALSIPRGRPQYEVRFVNGPATCGPRPGPKGAGVKLAIALVRLELLAEGIPEEFVTLDAAVARRIDRAGGGK